MATRKTTEELENAIEIVTDHVQDLVETIADESLQEETATELFEPNKEGTSIDVVEVVPIEHEPELLEPEELSIITIDTKQIATTTTTNNEEFVTNKARSPQIRGRKSIKEVKITAKDSDLNQEFGKLSSPIKDDKSNNSEELENDLKEDHTNKAKDDDMEVQKKELSSDEASAATVSGRLTRKTVAHEVAVSTRVTRNRHTSRPETPPANNSGSSNARTRRMTVMKKCITESSPTTVKRKRGVEDALTGLGETIPTKYIKVEEKIDNDFVEDETESTDSLTITTKIKQELVDSEESMELAAANTNVNMRSRARGRKSQTPTTSAAATINSPSTRSTRQTKLNSKSPTPQPTTAITYETKRRRITISAIKRSSSEVKLQPGKDELKVDKRETESAAEEELFDELEMAEGDNKAVEVMLGNGGIETLSVDTTDIVLRGGDDDDGGSDLEHNKDSENFVDEIRKRPKKKRYESNKPK